MAPCLDINMRGNRVVLAVHLEYIVSCLNDVIWIWPAYACGKDKKNTRF